jgi:hypothetical protein
MFPLDVRASIPTDTLSAYLAHIVDAAAAAPASLTPVGVFIAGAVTYLEWVVQVPSHYGGAGFTWSYKGGTDGTDSTNAIHMDLQMKKLTLPIDLTSDLNVDGQAVSSIDETQSATPDVMDDFGTATVSHAAAGSPAKGDYMIIRLSRGGVADSNGDDGQIAKLLILET